MHRLIKLFLLCRLGALTLARNQALRHKDLDVKTAIGDAYEQVTAPVYITAPLNMMQLCLCIDQRYGGRSRINDWEVAYEQGKMIAVLPFVGKILDATKDSKSYRPSNPWIMGIMALLAEIYAMDRLKLNLKFEIEMVFRSLGLQVP